MAEDEIQKPRSWLRFWFKVAIYVAVFFAVIITTLSVIGGKSEMLKTGVEQFFTQASGHPAQIETFNGLHFFPDFRLDMEGLRIMESDAVSLPVAGVMRVKVAMGFWDMILRTGKLKAFDLEGLWMKEGFLHPREIVVERLALMHPEGSDPYLEGRGLLGGQAWSVHMGLESLGRAPYAQYRFGPQRDFSVALGGL
ncbi:MAG: hypothetical protein LRY62_01815 [Alphaproteobacteria bacterium]|nr:hypothetical protein [Alphaproteobacteria bacterium]